MRLPIGTYAEVEGPEDWIDRNAGALKVDPTMFQNDSYGRLFELWKLETGSEAKDLTFAAVGESAQVDVLS